jgi:hypothetical protein
MPRHNTKGNARSNKPKVSSQAPIEAFSTAKARLLRVVTKNFYNSHVALVDSPTYKTHLGNAKRPKEASSCIMATRADVNRLVSIVNARRMAGVESVSADASGSKDKNLEGSMFYDSGQYFEFVIWGASGKGNKVSASFTYSMLKVNNVWYMHHLESISVAGQSPQAVLSLSELETGFESDHGYTSDYEGDEDDENDEWDWSPLG